VCYPLTPNSASSKLDPNYARAFANRGIVYGRKREYDRAIQDFDQAIRLDPDLALLRSLSTRSPEGRRTCSIE
jgi:tetratricopeptide (TPR) repeat protein